jgi:predicted metal-dependent hydrolase
MPERESSSVDAAYQEGLELARAGSFFEAHEAFETAWRACAAGERDFFQGLVHVVVSAYQRGRGRQVAAERQRAKALRRLAPYAPVHRGIDVAALLGSLERAEPDPREHLVERHLQPPVAVEEEQEAERDQGRPG